MRRVRAEAAPVATVAQPAIEHVDATARVAMGMGDEHEIEGLERARLLREVTRDVDEDRARRGADQQRALGASRPAAAGTSAGGSRAENSHVHLLRETAGPVPARAGSGLAIPVGMNAGELCIRRVYTADATESIVAVAQRMARNNVGDLVVVEQTGDGVRPIGIVTDRDLVTRGIALGTPLALELTVRDVMHESLVTAFDDEAVDIVLRRIKQHGIRRIPIVDRAGLLQGILTLDDIVAWIGEQLSNAARLLEDQAAAVS